MQVFACALACSANSLRRASPAARHWNTAPSAPHVSSVVSSGDHQTLRTFAACALHIGWRTISAGHAALPESQLPTHFAGCTLEQRPFLNASKHCNVRVLPQSVLRCPPDDAQRLAGVGGVQLHGGAVGGGKGLAAAREPRLLAPLDAKLLQHSAGQTATLTSAESYQLGDEELEPVADLLHQCTSEYWRLNPTSVASSSAAAVHNMQLKVVCICAG